MIDNKKLCGYYNYTVILTYLGMIIGFIGITFTLKEAYLQAIICLMGAGICDMFDGTIAATKERDESEKSFGIQIDSLSDLICFGVLPALIVYSYCGKTTVSLFLSSLYVLCALIRLAYFNVLEEKRQKCEIGGRTSYVGLPVTSVALIFPILYILQYALSLQMNGLYMLAIGIMAMVFVIPIKIKKPSHIGKASIVLVGCLEFLILVLGRV